MRPDSSLRRDGRGARPCGGGRAAGIAAVALCGAIVAGGQATASVASDVSALTGKRTRIVWTRDMYPGAETTYPEDPVFRLMGLDTTEGAEREILPGPNYYQHPIITPDGGQVIYSDLGSGKVRIVNWDGTGDHEFCAGYLYDVYRDSATQVDWAVVNDYSKYNPGATGDPRVRRVRIDNPGVEEVVNTSRTMWHESFDISADGARAGGMPQHPEVGVFDLVNGTYSTRGGYACNTSLAPDNSYMFFHMIGGGHTNILIYHDFTNPNYSAQIFFTGAPNMVNHPVLGPHPSYPCYEGWNIRWGNDVRFLTMTGPALAPFWDNLDVSRWNIYIGRFNSSFTDIEAWVQVTDNCNMDAYPDSWIGDIGPSAPSITSTAPTKAYVGLPYAYQVSATGDPAPTIAASGLPGWLTLDGNTISGAPTAAGTTGAITVTASNTRGQTTQTFAIEVASAIRLDCGTQTPVSGWLKGNDYVSGGSDFTFAGTPDTSGVANAAPVDVYKTCRHDQPTFSIPVANGSYAVRLHFYDEYGSRDMTVTMEGQVVLDNFDVVSQSGGKAVVKAFPSVAVGDGALTIAFSKGSGNDAFVSGVEVLTEGASPQNVSIDSFTASPTTISEGQSSTLTWATSNATSVTLDGNGVAADGSTTVSPAATTTYTLVAEGSGGPVQRQVTVNLNPMAITITSPAGGEVYYVGTTARIAWTVANVDSVVVMYSADNGAYWDYVESPGNGTFDTSGGASHSFDWVIPDTPSPQCIVNVSEYFLHAEGESGVFEIRAVTDSDSDGMDDGWEIDVFGDTSQDETTDFDWDGYSDLQEFQKGTDPTDPDDPRTSGAVGLGLTCVTTRGSARTGSEALLLVAALLAAAFRRRCSGRGSA